jgi:hypothetical protein
MIERNLIDYGYKVNIIEHEDFTWMETRYSNHRRAGRWHNDASFSVRFADRCDRRLTCLATVKVSRHFLKARS